SERHEIDIDHPMAAFEQPGDDMAAGLAGAAGEEDALALSHLFASLLGRPVPGALSTGLPAADCGSTSVIAALRSKVQRRHTFAAGLQPGHCAPNFPLTRHGGRT